jgi:secondary thiamine-phosphate synthase enzyme
MNQGFHELVIATRGRGLHEFTHEVERWVGQNQFKDGLLTLHVRPTSASLLIQENADPDVRRDLKAFFQQLAPDGDTFTTVLDQSTNAVVRNTIFEEIPPTQCRFVRLTTINWPRAMPLGIIEFTVFGKPAGSLSAAQPIPSAR